MKKCWMVVVTVLCCLNAMSIDATQTRLNGLGVANWMVEDDFNIWLNPAQVNSYPDTVNGELNPNAASQWAGVTWLMNPKNLTGATKSVDKTKKPVAKPEPQKPELQGNNYIIGAFVARPYTGITNAVGTNATGSDVGLLSGPNIAPTTRVTGAGGGYGMTALTPQNKIDLLLGTEFNNMPIGITFNYAANTNQKKYTNEATTKANNDGTVENKRDSTDLNFTVGTILPALFLFKDNDISFTLTVPTVKNTYSERWYSTATTRDASDDRELKNTNSMWLNFFWRGKLVNTNRIRFLCPVIQYTTTNLSSTYTDKRDTTADGSLDTNIEQKRTETRDNLMVGGALNFNVSEKTLLIVAATFNLANTIHNANTTNIATGAVTEEYKWNQTTINIPLNFAVEHKISSVFTGRVGLAKSVYQTQQTKIDDPNWQNALVNNRSTSNMVTDPQGAITVSLGTGINLGKGLTIDAQILQNILFSGTYIISGNNVGNPVTQITAVYRF